MAVNHRERKCYWKHWTAFIKPFAGVDSLLTNVPVSDEQIKLLTAFAEQVREGHCGHVITVQAGTIQVMLCTIGKTFKLDGLPNPAYYCEGN
jgi:hypothetical protein